MTSWNHVGHSVSDLERSIRFYSEVFGFAERNRLRIPDGVASKLLRVPEPVVPLRLFNSSIFTFANLGAFGMSMVMFGSIIYVPIYAQGVLAVNAS